MIFSKNEGTATRAVGENRFMESHCNSGIPFPTLIMAACSMREPRKYASPAINLLSIVVINWKHLIPGAIGTFKSLRFIIGKPVQIMVGHGKGYRFTQGARRCDVIDDAVLFNTDKILTVQLQVFFCCRRYLVKIL